MKKIVIIGAGFAGLNLAKRLKGTEFEVWLLDRYNFHQFQPLFYQVATSALEPSAISFPLRKVFHGFKNVHIRTCEVKRVDPEHKVVHTDLCNITYDVLVIATGADTNYFGLQQIEEHAIPMKSVGEALYLRNHILQRFEYAVSQANESLQRAMLTFVVVGGGATGVEVSGAIAEMKKYVLKKDYPELDLEMMRIILVEAGGRTLSAMSNEASEKSKLFLEKLGVEVKLNTHMSAYDGNEVVFGDNQRLKCKTVIWAAGVKGNTLEGIKPDVIVRGRFRVDRYNRVAGYNDVYAIGDIAYMETPRYPNGHPQLANVAINQGKLLAMNLKAMQRGKRLKEYEYNDPGSMATVGKNLAVVDFPRFKMQGFIAWVLWMTVHLMLILGIKNKLFILMDWAWSYISHDASLRLIIRPGRAKGRQIKQEEKEEIHCGEIIE